MVDGRMEEYSIYISLQWWRGQRCLLLNPFLCIEGDIFLHWDCRKHSDMCSSEVLYTSSLTHIYIEATNLH